MLAGVILQSIARQCVMRENLTAYQLCRGLSIENKNVSLLQNATFRGGTLCFALHPTKLYSKGHSSLAPAIDHLEEA